VIVELSLKSGVWKLVFTWEELTSEEISTEELGGTSRMHTPEPSGTVGVSH